jgi:hypothetical protein
LLSSARPFVALKAQTFVSMEEDRSDMIAQFCAITGAPAHIGENYLIAHDWALERAVDFYMDHPPQEGAAGGGPDPFDEPAGQRWATLAAASTAAVHAACCHLQLLHCAVHAYCLSLF